jgi:transcriptional regulator with XRE-family HTH domain
MLPADWRKKAGLSLREVARRLGCSSASSVLRWETGEREAPNSVVLAYEHESGGAVSGADLNRVRSHYKRSHSNRHTS